MAYLTVDIAFNDEQAKMSPIEFDYLGYFFLRYDEYKKKKGKNFLLARSYLSGHMNE